MKLILILSVIVPIIVSVNCSINDCMKITSRPKPSFFLPPKNIMENSILADYPEKNIEFARHHVIPWNVLRDFFNVVLNSNKNIYADVCHVLYNVVNALTMNASPSEDLTENIEFPDFTNNIIRKLIEATRPTDLEAIINSPQPNNVMYGVHSYLSWFPGNIFIGPAPKKRSDDPGEYFEIKAKHVIDERLYGQLLQAHDSMIEYNRTHNTLNKQNKRELIQKVLVNLQQSFTYKEPTRFNPNSWILDHKTNKWRINTARKPSSTVRLDEVTEPPAKKPRRDLRRPKGNTCTYDDIYNSVKNKLNDYCKKNSSSCTCKI